GWSYSRSFAPAALRMTGSLFFLFGSGHDGSLDRRPGQVARGRTVHDRELAGAHAGVRFRLDLRAVWETVRYGRRICDASATGMTVDLDHVQLQSCRMQS